MSATDTSAFLKEHREIWQKKPVLREIYQNYFTLIRRACISGITLELGGGSGNFKDFVPETISVDIVLLPWLDAVADAQKLPFRDQSIANIVMLDVLHHIEFPSAFFREADRILQPGGRLIFIEPAITPFSRIFLHFFHPEPIDMRVNPFNESTADPERHPFDANQAIPTLLIGRYRTLFSREFPQLKIVRIEYLDIIAYPLSGGFRPWCLLPQPFLPYLLWIERHIISIAGFLVASRLYCIIEKSQASANS
jgi:SAM-dependent methyltransferase